MKIKTLWIVLAAVAVLIVPLLIFGGYAAVKYNTLVADSKRWRTLGARCRLHISAVPTLCQTW